VDNHPVAADAVQEQVHRAHAADFRRKLHGFHQILAQRAFLIAVQILLELGQNVVVGVEEKSAGARGRIADAIAGSRLHHLANCLNHRRGVKYWLAPRADSAAERCRSSS
jgi:hypothetical protein